MKRILITGGNGYVGHELTKLASREHEICVVDNLRAGPLRLKNEIGSRIRFEQADINDQGMVGEVIATFAPDAIVHLAALHYIPECDQNPSLAAQTNIVGTLNVLLACPPGARFVHASSGAVYKPDANPHAENSSREPSDVYGYTKLHSEDYVEYISARRQISSVIVRLFNVVGPGETTPHLIPEIVSQLKAGRKTIGLGNLSPKRDYIHVHDAARGFLAAALNSAVPPGKVVTVNLGTSKSFSVAEIVEKLRVITSIDFSYQQEEGRTRKVDRPFLAADNNEMRRRFDWEPSLTIDDALSDLWRTSDMADHLLEKYR
jgi:UDP-glucose 4-epimerase